MIRILLADDHALITDGIVNLLAGTSEIEIACVCADGEKALQAFQQEEIDIAILDIDMPKVNGLQCAEEILAVNPDAKIAMLTMHEEMALIERCIQLGVKGYFLKTITKKELVHAITTIADGNDYFPADVTKALIEKRRVTPSISQDAIINDLSKRELEIIQLVAKGQSNKEIAELLFISPRTVDTHRTNIMKKLGVNNVVGLVRFAFRNGLSE